MEKFRIRLRAVNWQRHLGCAPRVNTYVTVVSLLSNCCRDPEITYKRRDPELARSAIASDSFHVVVERHARTSRLMTDHFYERYAVSTSTPRCRRISLDCRLVGKRTTSSDPPAILRPFAFSLSDGSTRVTLIGEYPRTRDHCVAAVHRIIALKSNANYIYVR